MSRPQTSLDSPYSARLCCLDDAAWEQSTGLFPPPLDFTLEAAHHQHLLFERDNPKPKSKVSTPGMTITNDVVLIGDNVSDLRVTHLDAVKCLLVEIHALNALIPDNTLRWSLVEEECTGHHWISRQVKRASEASK